MIPILCYLPIRSHPYHPIPAVTPILSHPIKPSQKPIYALISP